MRRCGRSRPRRRPRWPGWPWLTGWARPSWPGTGSRSWRSSRTEAADRSAGAGGSDEQAGPVESFALGDGVGIVSVVAGQDPPAGAGEEFGGFVGFQGGSGRLAQRGDRGLEAGSGLAVGSGLAGSAGLTGSAGPRDADRQAAADRRDLAELTQDAFQYGR